MRTQLKISYEDIISPENLFAAWQEFLPGKKKKRDVQEFGLRLADNILQLHWELANFSYAHGSYTAFNISDPKPRNIHKASVRDRILHHAIYRRLYPFFDRTFIADSYSCRIAKGTHRAISRFEQYGGQVSKNHTKTVWVLKCDIKKFFASIDHKILLKILASYIADKNITGLLEEVILSFLRKRESRFWIPDQVGTDIKFKFSRDRKGLPLGNLTSQLFCNIFMNEFDRFVKHKLHQKYYIRYADDFVFLSDSKTELLSLTPHISMFLEQELKLFLHPNKIFIKTLASGVDFLGWTHFPHHRILRKTSKRRMFRRIAQHPANETLQSYLALIKHGKTFKLRQRLLVSCGLWPESH